MTTLIEKAQLLRSTPMFSGLDLEMILPISDKLGALTLKSGKPIFSAGDEGTHVYLIAEGEVSVGNRQLGKGELFGEEALLSGRPHAYTATSRGSAVVLALSKANFFAALEECPPLAIALLEVYAGQVQQRH